MPTPGRARILVVDDEPDVRARLDGVLRCAGYDVEQAEDGQAALEAVRICRPDLVITDIVMPRLDGWQLCRRLRGDPSTARLPVIFLSLRSRAEHRTHGLRLGADDFVTKPFDAEELVARVQAVLKRAALSAGAQPAAEGIAGSLRDMSLVDIAQVLDLGRKTATVRVTRPGGAGAAVGSLHFHDGSLVHAVHDGLVGAPALARLLLLDDGHFEIVLGGPAPGRTLAGSTQTLLLEALRAADETRASSAAAACRSRASGDAAPAGPSVRPAAGGDPPPAARPGGAAAARAALRERGGDDAVPPDLGAIRPTLLDLFALGVIEPKR